MKPPRDRWGALPFPGPFTAYQAADPQALGRHRYDRTPRFLQADESGRGIVYTVRAGFLDVEHIRITTDSVRYCTERVRAAMRADEAFVVLRTIEGSMFFVTLHYPAGWKSSTKDPGDTRAADELAILTGQRLGYLMMTWHEIATWFGYRTVVFVDESLSSFTYDDAMSHVVGLRVAGRALRDASAKSYDEAVTAALSAELAELGAVTPAQTQQAASAVKGIWWSRGKPLKRQLDVGMPNDAVRPWLVPGLSFAPAAEAEWFALPTLEAVCGRDFSGFYSVLVDPRFASAERMRRLLPGHPARFDAGRDFPLLIAAIRGQMQRRFAADVDRPWPLPEPTTQPATGTEQLTLAPSTRPATP